MKSSSRISIAIIGSERSGKTCFIAGLSVLTDPRSEDKEFIGRSSDDFKVRQYLQELADSLHAGRWPQKTVAGFQKVLEFEVRYRDGVFPIQTRDFAGEDLNSEKTVGQLTEWFDSCDYALFLTRPEDLDPVEPSQQVIDHDGQIEAQRIRAERIQTLIQIACNSRSIVAVVLTKADTYPDEIRQELASPKGAESFLKRRAPKLYQNLIEHSSRKPVFPVSSVGVTDQCDGIAIPRAGRVRPSGYHRLFDWLAAKRRGAKVRAFFLHPVSIAAAGVVVLGIVSFAALFIAGDRAVARATSPLSSLEQSITSYLEVSWKRPALQRRMDSHLLSFVDDFRTRVESGSTDYEQFIHIERQLESLASLPNLNSAAEAKEIREISRNRRDRLLYEQVRKAYHRPAMDLREVTDLGRRYLREFPNGQHTSEVNAILQEVEDGELDASRRRLAGMPASNEGAMRSKLGAINDFLERFDRRLHSSELEGMRAAVDAGNRLLQQRTFMIHLREAGSSKRERNLEVRVSRQRGAGTQDNKFPKAKGKTVQWRGAAARWQLDWRLGDTVQIDLWAGHRGPWRGTVVGTHKSTEPLSLATLGGRTDLQPRAWEDDFEALYVTFYVEGFTARDWEALSAYVSPGTSW